MFDVAPTELMLVAFVALVVIGPKDLPKAMRFVGYWVGKARGVARQFRAGFDTMMREAEVAEMEKKWAAENERIMREHPPEHVLAAPVPALGTDHGVASDEPIMTHPPVLKAEPQDVPPVTDAGPDKAAS
jgi:sec-independent protein translocase protein TatB